MAETRVTGRSGAVTITSDGYGFGSIQTGPPILPEPRRPEVRNLDRKQLKKKFGAGDEELEEIFALPGFPGATARRQGIGEWTTTLLWSEAVIDRWVAEQRAKAATITRLLG